MQMIGSVEQYWRAKQIIQFCQIKKEEKEKKSGSGGMMQSSTTARQVIILLGLTLILVDLPKTFSHRVTAYM